MLIGIVIGSDLWLLNLTRSHIRLIDLAASYFWQVRKVFKSWVLCVRARQNDVKLLLLIYALTELLDDAGANWFESHLLKMLEVLAQVLFRRANCW